MVRPVARGAVRPSSIGAYAVRIAACHCFDSESLRNESVRRIASSNPRSSAERKSAGTIASPHRPPMYAHSASP